MKLKQFNLKKVRSTNLTAIKLIRNEERNVMVLTEYQFFSLITDNFLISMTFEIVL